MPSNNEITFDVFVSYERRDANVAAEVAETLRSYGLSVFLDAQVVSPGTAFEDVVWEAMWESEAVVAIVPGDEESSRMSFELGAAFASNKPIYAVVSGQPSSRIPATLRHATILPLSRVDEIAQTILRNANPLTDGERALLADAYLDAGTTVDQLATQPQQLADIVKRFNKASGRRMSGEQVLRVLLTMRKRGQLASASKKPQKKA